MKINFILLNAYQVGHYLYFSQIQNPPIDSMSSEGRSHEKITGNVEFRDVHFTYPSREDVKVGSIA